MGELVTVDLADVVRVARDVVATEPGSRVAEVLADRLRSMQTEVPAVPKPTEIHHARARAALRRYGL